MPPLESIAGLLILLAAGALVLWAALVLWTAHRLTRPPRRTYGSAKARGWAGDPSELTPPRAFEEWTLRSRGRDLPVWDIPGDDGAGPVVIFTHGWGDGRIHGLLRAPALLPHCSRLILWELPGHGDAPGTCALGAAEATDLRALIEQVAGGARGADGRASACGVVLYGFSLGAGVSIAAAGEEISPQRHGEHRGDTEKGGEQERRGSGEPRIKTTSRDLLPRHREHRGSTEKGREQGGGGSGETRRKAGDSPRSREGHEEGTAEAQTRPDDGAGAAARDIWPSGDLRSGTLPISAIIAEAPYALPPTPARAVLELSAMPWRTNLLPALWLVGLGLANRGVLAWNEALRGGWLRAGGSFDRARLARGLRCPLLVLHGEHDEVCPLADARAIVTEAGAAAGGPAGGAANDAHHGVAQPTLTIIPGAGHNDLWTDDHARAAASEALVAFLRAVRAPSAPAPLR